MIFRGNLPVSFIALVLFGCSSTSGKPVAMGTGGGVNPDAGAAGGGAGTGAGGSLSQASGGSLGSGGVGGLTGGKLGTTQCSDGLDNDGDGKIDLQDPECVSPLDNDESSFATGIPGDNVDACKQDCFFDGNSGMGDDGCNWDLKCDPANTGAGSAASCPYDPAAHNCSATQSAKCVKDCGAITPNGCDCFGCCELPGADHPVRLDPACTSASFNDPAKCPVCTQQTSCMNPCGKCEYCLGKTTLDPSCSVTADGGAAPDGGTSTPTCRLNQVVCGTNPSLCGEGTMCVTGCCVSWVF